VAGQQPAKQAAEICAAGGHHLLLTGPPGSGATMLAERIPGLLPPLTRAQALEVTAMHSLARTLPAGRPLVTTAPMISPHHTATRGGRDPVRPGAAPLAHHGVLFLDQAPEFDRAVLDALRQPLETGRVTLARGGQEICFPADFTLILAARPCPCAAAAGQACSCTPLQRRRYLARLSGPLRERADITIAMDPPPPVGPPGAATFSQCSTAVACRVAAARQRAAARLAGTPWQLNARVPAAELHRFSPAPGALAPLERAVELGQLSRFAAGRVLAVAWTLADLADRPQPEAADISRALRLRLGEAT
jgi:magnesium chelatase family protein